MRRLILVGVAAVLLAGAVAAGFLLGRENRPPAETAPPVSTPPPASPSTAPDPEASECRRAALRLRALLADWRDIWDPYFDDEDPPERPAKAWRTGGARFVVLRVNVATIQPPPPLETAHALLVDSVSRAERTFEIVAAAIEAGATDEALAEAKNEASKARQFWIATDRNLDRRPCA